jgi:phage major head subunit gpT-like protein
MAMLRNKYSQLLAAGIKKLFVEFRDTELKNSYMEKIFNVESSGKAYEDEVLFGDIGAMPEKTENDGFQYTELTPGGSKRFVHLTYGLGARYSWELAQDDQYGIIKSVPKALARSGAFTRQQVPINVLNQGFLLVKTADGETLFNNQHPLLGGKAATEMGPGVSNVISAAGTNPNRPAVDVDLSYRSSDDAESY